MSHQLQSARLTSKWLRSTFGHQGILFLLIVSISFGSFSTTSSASIKECGSALAANDNIASQTAVEFTSTLDLILIVHPHRAFDGAGGGRRSPRAKS